MKQLALLCTLLIVGACSVAGDYDRPYDDTYRPIEGPVVGPFALPEDSTMGMGGMGGMETPDQPAALLPQQCGEVQSAWPSTTLHCILICQEARQLANCDAPVPESFSNMLEGICIYICEGSTRDAAREYFVNESADDFFCPNEYIELCPTSCRLCDGTVTPTDCRAQCDDPDLWKCVGHTAYITDDQAFEIDDANVEQELELQLLIGGAVDACLDILY